MKRILLFILGFTVAILLVLFLPAWVALHLLLEGWLGVDENAPSFVQKDSYDKNEREVMPKVRAYKRA